MDQAWKTGLLFLLLLLAVVVGAYYYSRALAPVPEAAPAVEAQPEPPPSHPALEQGLEALRDGRFEDAIGHFDQVEPGDPARRRAVYHTAVACLEQGDHERALALFDGLLDTDPDNPELHVGRSWALYRLGRLRDGEMACLRAIEIDPSHVTARYNVAFLRMVQDRVHAGLNAYQRALAHDPQGNHAMRAIGELAAVHESRPELAGVHFALALFANTQGRTDTEIEELEHFLATDPQGPIGDTARQRLIEARRSLP